MGDDLTGADVLVTSHAFFPLALNIRARSCTQQPMTGMSRSGQLSESFRMRDLVDFDWYRSNDSRFVYFHD